MSELGKQLLQVAACQNGECSHEKQPRQLDRYVLGSEAIFAEYNPYDACFYLEVDGVEIGKIHKNIFNRLYRRKL